jgi:hypothetical protein
LSSCFSAKVEQLQVKRYPWAFSADIIFNFSSLIKKLSTACLLVNRLISMKLLSEGGFYWRDWIGRNTVYDISGHPNVTAGNCVQMSLAYETRGEWISSACQNAVYFGAVICKSNNGKRFEMRGTFDWFN